VIEEPEIHEYSHLGASGRIGGVWFAGILGIL
jgi:hypothetical protein